MRRLLTFVLLCSIATFAQNRRVDAIALSRSGLPAPGASVAICSQTAISAISESGNTVTVTSTLAPPPVNGTVTIFDVVPAGYNGTFAVVSSSPTQFTYFNPLTGLGPGTSFGAAITSGSSACSTPIALCSSPSDVACASPNPLTADGLGNYFFYLQPAVCTLGAPCSVQIFGSAITTRVLNDQSYGSASGPTLKTNGTTNGSQTLLNLVNGTNISITQDGVGDVTISASGGTTGLALNKWMGYASGGNGTCQAGNNVSTGAFGANTNVIALSAGPVAATSTEAGACDVTIGGGTPTGAFILDNGSNVNTGIMSEFRARVGNPTNLTNKIFFVGVGGSIPYASATPAGATLSFRCATTVPDTDWQAMTGSIAHDSGVACDLAMHTFRITITSGPTATFYIDGTQVFQTTSNIPSASTNMSPFASLSNNSSGNTEQIFVSYMYLQFNTP